MSSWANDEDPKVAKVLFDNEKTRELIKPNTIEGCFKAACMSNNLKKIDLLIDKIGSDIINKYFKLACENGNLKVVAKLIPKVKDSDKIKPFCDIFLTERNKKNQLSEQDLRLSLLLVKNVNDKKQKVKRQDYNIFKKNIEDLIDDLIKKKRINNDVKDSIKNLKKNEDWNNNEKTSNFDKIISTFDVIEQNLPQPQI